MLFLLFSAFTAQSQVYQLKGKITTNTGEPVAFATIEVKNSPSGTTTAKDGSYEMALTKGNYNLLVSMVGFKTLELPVELHKHTIIDIILDQEAQHLSEVTVTAKRKDRAEQIMRQVIRKKDSIQSAAGAYSYSVYIKATLVDSTTILPKKRNRKSYKEGKTDQPGMVMTEILSRVDVASGNHLKENRLAVSGKEHGKGMFYLSVTEGNFNFYNHLVHVPALSPTAFLSPISTMGLVAYQFKTLKVERKGKHRVYTLSVKPLQVTNATVEGEMTVSDSAWVVLHARFRFPSYHLQEFNSFELEQDFGYMDNKAWMLTRQQFTYTKKGKNQVYTGQTTATYTDFELNKQFSKRHFNAELSSTGEQAYEKDSFFWRSVRQQSLSETESSFVEQEERVLRYRKSEAYLDSVDRLVNKITWQKLGVFGQSYLDHHKERTWHFPPLVSLYKPFAFGGGRINVSAYHSKTFPSRRYFDINTNISYGLRNNDVNGRIDFYRKYNPFKSGYYGFSAGREFSFINEGDALINMIKRNNFYLNNFLAAAYGLELLNGLVVSTDLQIAFRKSVDGYKTGKMADSILIHVADDNQPVAFQPYNALYGKIKLRYTPGEQFRREPKEKIILGSKWPTFYVQWEKGIPDFANSAVDFDYLEFGMEQSIRVGLIGVSRYSIKTGEYLNQQDLRFIDYKIQRRGDPVLFMNPHKSFQALDSTFPLFNRFVEGHIFHEFNGLFLNKIPFLKKLQLREVAGAGILIAPERNLQYGELYLGVERAFTSPFNPLDKFKLGVYVVGAAANNFHNPVQFKVGFTTWDKRRKRWF